MMASSKKCWSSSGWAGEGGLRQFEEESSDNDLEWASSGCSVVNEVCQWKKGEEKSTRRRRPRLNINLIRRCNKNIHVISNIKRKVFAMLRIHTRHGYVSVVGLCMASSSRRHGNAIYVHSKKLWRRRLDANIIFFLVQPEEGWGMKTRAGDMYRHIMCDDVRARTRGGKQTFSKVIETFFRKFIATTKTGT